MKATKTNKSLEEWKFIYPNSLFDSKIRITAECENDEQIHVIASVTCKKYHPKFFLEMHKFLNQLEKDLSGIDVE